MATGPEDKLEYKLVGQDEAAPFEYHVKIPVGRVGEVVSFKAEATDVDGYVSPMSPASNLTIKADEPPTATITKPDNDESVIIDGQDIEVFVATQDDLGADGIDRVVFYVNDVPVKTEYNSYSDTSGAAAMDNVYRAEITPPDGAKGFVIYAVAYDVLGQTGRTQTVRVGKIEDTVAPKIEVLSPIDGDILTAGEPVQAIVGVSDIGSEQDRRVYMNFIRETLDPTTKQWQTLASKEIELVRNDAVAGEYQSDPDKFYYIYRGELASGDIFARGSGTERVRTVTRVVTPNHTESATTRHEIGLPISQRRFFLPQAGAEQDAESVYYTAVDQFTSDNRTGAFVASWSTVDPMRLEPGIGNATYFDSSDDVSATIGLTGLFIADETSEPASASGDGKYYLYSDLMNGAAEIFLGTITDISADADFVLVAKSGSLLPYTGPKDLEGFPAKLASTIAQDPTTGGVYLDNAGGELLIYSVVNGDGQFGLPYLLKGRVDMPYPTVYGLARKDDLVLVANGNGGVQVVDISDLTAPYHVGYIKPNGYARDVKIKGDFAYIAASNEGLVIADIADPSMPIVAKLDTLGVANRVFIEGSTAYIADMAGDGQVSQINIINIKDPYNPILERTVELKPARKDLVADGVYDVIVAGGKAYATVHYSDQEDKPAQSLVEIVDLQADPDDTTNDITTPAMLHRHATADDFAPRGLVLARGGLQVAGAKQGIVRYEMPALTVLGYTPHSGEEDWSTGFAPITIELSGVLPVDVDLTKYIAISELSADPRFGQDASSLFDIGFAQRNGEDARRFIEIRKKDGVELNRGSQYFVTVKAGLKGVSGAGLQTDFTFDFVADGAGSAEAPKIHAVEPSTGSIEGNTDISVTGLNFGNTPSLYLGGQQLVVDKVIPGTESGEPYDRIVARTVPNSKGPAAVKVVGENGLSDTVLGAFTYVDILEISYIDPAVVRVSQAGAGDVVNIVGYGFDSTLTVKAYQSGHPQTAVEDKVGSDRLHLYSAEKMQWRVPDFGEDYRGFVDVEISDGQGRRFLLPQALFYGHLQVNRQLEVDTWSENYIPDALKLPPGQLVDMTADADMGLVYVLGQGIPGNRLLRQSNYYRGISRHYPTWMDLAGALPAGRFGQCGADAQPWLLQFAPGPGSQGDDAAW